ncbi:MAG: calcium-binding protein [Azospirillaceae bacterium]
MAYYYGTSGSDYETGTFYADVFYMYGGDDTVDAKNGDDYVSAGSGSDTIYGGDGDDEIEGGGDRDTLYGELGDDTLYGGAGDDDIIGGLENDQMYGGDGNDRFFVDGNAGWDSFSGGSGTDQILLNDLNPYALWGEIKIDYLNSIERIANNDLGEDVDILADGYLDLSNVEVDGIRQIVGSSGADTIIGTSNASSSSLDDTIDGKGGNDTLAGGDGDDSLTGGSGADTFVFGAAEGSDVIEDFADGVDLIDLGGTSANGIGDLSISDTGSGTDIYIDGTLIEVVGIASSALDSSDFLF